MRSGGELVPKVPRSLAWVKGPLSWLLPHRLNKPFERGVGEQATAGDWMLAPSFSIEVTPEER